MMQTTILTNIIILRIKKSSLRGLFYFLYIIYNKNNKETMAIPFYHVNSMTYSPGVTAGVLSINIDYHHLRGGASFSVIGFPNTLTFSLAESSGVGEIYTYSISLSASNTYNLTFSVFKSPYYNVDEFGFTSSTLSYQINRQIHSYTFYM